MNTTQTSAEDVATHPALDAQTQGVTQCAAQAAVETAVVALKTECPAPDAPKPEAAKPQAKPEAKAAKPHGSRLLFIDGLRGFAALIVMLFHFFTPKVSPLYDYLHGMLPSAMEWLILQGFVGVEIFFVLSGFVIAYALRGVATTPSYAVNFIVRRSVRLDPPYWTVIFLSIGYRCILWHDYTASIFQTVGLKNLLTNMFYVADLFNRPLYVGVAWTLCLEVRFYLSLMGMLVIGNLISTWFSPKAGKTVMVMMFVPLTIVSMFLRFGTGELHYIETWYMFAMGVTLALALNKQISERWLWIFVVAALAGQLWVLDFRASVAIGTVLAIYSASKLNKMGSWLAWGWIQSLGRVSYSLYLVHCAVGLGVMDIMMTYGDGSRFLAAASFITASLASIVAAHLLHRFVEGPCVQLAKLLKPSSGKSKKPQTEAKPIVATENPPLPVGLAALPA